MSNEKKYDQIPEEAKDLDLSNVFPIDKDYIPVNLPFETNPDGTIKPDTESEDESGEDDPQKNPPKRA